MSGPHVRIALVLGLCWATATATAAAEPDGAGHGPIVFASNRSGPWRIWTVRPDGSRLRELIGGEHPEHDVDPVFSPDGKTILFSSTRGGTTGIWTAPADGSAADGSAAKRICHGDQAEWSPDGRQIVFRREEQLFTRELAGGRERRISPADWPHPSAPAFSPDGKTIAFACRWDAGNAIFTVPAGGGAPVKVYGRKGACEPHFSPDGKRIVYETETNVCTIAPDGTRNRPVTYFGGVQRYGRYSPDGKWIVFCQGPSERGPWQLYRIGSQGGPPIRITEDGSDVHPDWK